jgi:hypothetical protein
MLHLVMDNYGTHKEAHVQRWLKKHPRFVCHFVPTSSSWLNLVERWLRELTDKAVRRGSFASVPDLKKAIDEFLAAWNEDPKVFVWIATVELLALLKTPSSPFHASGWAAHSQWGTQTMMSDKRSESVVTDIIEFVSARATSTAPQNLCSPAPQ